MTTERQLRYQFGLYLIGLHLLILMTIVGLRLTGGFDTREFTTLLGVIVPMFSGYSSAIVVYIIKDRRVDTDSTPPVSRAYAALLCLFPTILGVVVEVAVVLEAFRVSFENFEDFKTFVMSFEALFAATVSVMVYSLFDRVSAGRRR